MKKRDFTSAFENDNTINTGVGLDDAIHGIAPKLDTGRIVARPISIFEIYPDPTQPRRAIPSSVRQGWDGDPRQVEHVLSAWLRAVEEESGQAYDLDKYLNPHSKTEEVDNDDRDDHAVGPMEATLQGLVDLAATIYRDGLTNPITVAPVENAYRLETGERRWLAYHLLHAKIPDGKWEKIPARIMDVPNVWRQAAENNARDNLNAVGKARQYALLMMILYDERGETFQQYDSFKHERHFYAQALNIDAVPYGKRDQLLSAMALKSPAELTRCRTLLGLPDSVWTLADDWNLPQSVLLECAGVSEEEALQIVSSWNDSGNTTFVQDKKPTVQSKKREDVEEALFAAEDSRKIKKLLSHASKIRRDDIKHLAPEIQQQYLDMADCLERLAQDIRRALENKT